MVKIPDDARFITPDDDILLPNKPENLINDLSLKYPSEKKGIRSYIMEMMGAVDELESLSQNKRPSNFRAQYPKLWNIKDKTLAQFIDNFIKTPSLKELLTFGWGAYGLPPSRLSAFYYIIATGGYGKNGLYYIKSRSQDLSDALADTIEKSGGTILYETRIKKIALKDNSVNGVATNDGKRLPAKIIVSNACAMSTLNKMLPQKSLPPDYLERIAGFKPSISTFIIWLGLKRDLTNVIKNNRIIISSGRGHEADYISCLKGEIDKISFSATIYDNYYKGYSYPETSTITIIALCGYEPWNRIYTINS